MTTAVTGEGNAVNLGSLLARNHRRSGPGSATEPERILPLAEGVIVADHDLAIQTANQAAADFLGWGSPAELVGSLGSAVWGLFDAERGREIQVALAMRGHWSGTVFLTRADGSLVESFLTACSLQAAGGMPAGLVITIRRPIVAPTMPDAPVEGESYGVEGLPGTFSLYYQPEIDLVDGSVAGCEALLRWWHPGLGIVSPGLALAHPRWSRRLDGLQAWSVYAACRQIAAWDDQGTAVHVALNLSEHQLEDRELLARVHQALALTGIRADRLAIDIPLSALVTHRDHTRAIAAGLRSLGCGVNIDGVTARTPLSALEGVPMTGVKVEPGDDQRWATTSDDATALSRALGVVTTAKSVETAPDLRVVRDAGFHRAFGHVFSPALAPAALVPLVGRPANAVVRRLFGPRRPMTDDDRRRLLKTSAIPSDGIRCSVVP